MHAVDPLRLPFERRADDRGLSRAGLTEQQRDALLLAIAYSRLLSASRCASVSTRYRGFGVRSNGRSRKPEERLRTSAHPARDVVHLPDDDGDSARHRRRTMPKRQSAPSVLGPLPFAHAWSSRESRPAPAAPGSGRRRRPCGTRVSILERARSTQDRARDPPNAPIMFRRGRFGLMGRSGRRAASISLNCSPI